MMNPRSIHVIRPGLLTTVQDLGRWGFQSQGVPVAGPMDPFSHRLANALVGNPREAAALEITLIGPELEFESDCVVAIGGAEFVVTLGGVAMPHAQAFQVPSRSRMQFGARLRGARAYLAVDGGFDVPLVLGSRSTHAPSGIGGWEGRPLHKGDRLPLGGSRRRRASPSRSTHAHDTLTDPAVVRFISWAGRRSIWKRRVRVRCSLRHMPSPPTRIAWASACKVPNCGTQEVRTSSPTPTPAGSVQVPGSGQPILLMADRPTTGGYPRIATVISADLGIAGQRAPGDTVLFRVSSASDALSALIARESALLALEAAWS